MNTNKILLAGLIGGVVAFVLGFLFYGVLLTDFFEANAGSATELEPRKTIFRLHRRRSR